ncbi:hypothetical protein PHMEG_00018155 [Phytophthora megakarya]|uniref:Reverse transcriptase n=1 Tax=Phytophthora megakarya TaxID=4795 RepID=A0A225VX92_9STRA|nr:hypothetical protein PHMEG_00018155 [Phytophthora megakarya]
MGPSIAEEHTICPNAPLQPLPNVKNYSLSTNKAESGANRCCLDESCFKHPTNVKPDIVWVKLDKPIKCTMAENTSILVDWIVKLNLSLQTIAGIFHIAEPVECLIIPGDSETFLQEGQVDLMAVAATDVNDGEFYKVDEPTVTNSTVHDDEVRNGVFEMVEKAIQDEFPLEYQNELTRIALKFILWRKGLGADRLARVPPTRIRLKPGANTYRCKSSKYPPDVRRFMENFNNKLVKLGWIYEILETRWACPALPVRKGNGEFHQTADYKPMIELVESTVGVMSKLEIDLEVV